MNYHSHSGSIPPGSTFPAASDKPGLYTAGGFTTSPYPPSQAGLPPGAQSQRYAQSVTQAYAMAANPTYYTPAAGYSPLSASGYPSATVGTGAFHTVGYPSLQSLPSTTPAGYPAQYPMPTYLGGSQLGATNASYAASGLPVTSAIYPSSAYTSTPIVASQIQRGYSVSPMGYPSQLGTNPNYPGASYQPQPPF